MEVLRLPGWQDKTKYEWQVKQRESGHAFNRSKLHHDEHTEDAACALAEVCGCIRVEAQAVIAIFLEEHRLDILR